MKLTKSRLKQIIKEELETVLSEGSGLLGNNYKWCPSGTQCAPQQIKTKWWGSK